MCDVTRPTRNYTYSTQLGSLREYQPYLPLETKEMIHRSHNGFQKPISTFCIFQFHHQSHAKHHVKKKTSNILSLKLQRCDPCK